MRVKGFEPFSNLTSKVLILGSFPSVKSREVEFYYGNPQNRFWKILADFFKCAEPKTLEQKKYLLLYNGIALWDVVKECEIIGSLDSNIKNFKVADVKNLLQKISVELIILNGGKAYEIFSKNFCDVETPYVKLPSTSPANTRFNKGEWFDALSRVFG